MGIDLIRCVVMFWAKYLVRYFASPTIGNMKPDAYNIVPGFG